jgi:hypothetical protein
MWYNKIVNDLSLIPDFIEHYEKQLANEKEADCKISGMVEKEISRLPGITEYWFGSLQEIEAVLNFLNVSLRKIRRKHFQKYLEHYPRALSSRDAEKYTDGEQEVIDFEILINEVAYLRNRYLGVMKGLESKNFMLGHLTRLKTAGMEDYTVGGF